MGELRRREVFVCALFGGKIRPTRLETALRPLKKSMLPLYVMSLVIDCLHYLRACVRVCETVRASSVCCPDLQLFIIIRIANPRGLMRADWMEKSISLLVAMFHDPSVIGLLFSPLSPHGHAKSESPEGSTHPKQRSLQTLFRLPLPWPALLLHRPSHFAASTQTRAEQSTDLSRMVLSHRRLPTLAAVRVGVPLSVP